MVFLFFVILLPLTPFFLAPLSFSFCSHRFTKTPSLVQPQAPKDAEVVNFSENKPVEVHALKFEFLA